MYLALDLETSGLKGLMIDDTIAVQVAGDLGRPSTRYF